MLQLHLRPDGQRRLLKGPAELADAIKSKVTVTATGYTVTLAIPLEILPADWQQAGVRLDLGLTGTDPGSDGPEALFLSGDGQLRIPDPQRFAIIKSVPKAAP